MAISWYKLGKNICTKGEVQAKMAPTTSCCAFRYIIPGDCQEVNCPKGAREATLGCGPNGPRNDTVGVAWVCNHSCDKQQNNNLSAYLPTQKRSKILAVMSSLTVAPVTSPMESMASSTSVSTASGVSPSFNPCKAESMAS